MPPKRKPANDGSDDERATKKPNPGSSLDQQATAPNGQPTNKVLPVNISFSPKTPGTLRLATWNVCSLAASQKKVCVSVRVHHRLIVFLQGFRFYVEAEDPDLLVLTETKVRSTVRPLSTRDRPSTGQRRPQRLHAELSLRTSPLVHISQEVVLSVTLLDQRYLH